MKGWIRTVFLVISSVAVFFCALYIFLVFEGKFIITRQLENLTGRKTSITYFEISPPLKLEIKDLDIDGLAKVDSVTISPSMVRLLLGKIAFNEIKIIRPRLTIERKKPDGKISPVLIQSAAASGQAGPPGKELTGSQAQIARAPDEPLRKRFPRVIIKRFSITDGILDFTDSNAGASGIKIRFKDINFNYTNLYLPPRPVITKFDLKARIPWRDEESGAGEIEAGGWVNLYKKDIGATVKIMGIDGVYLYPYYSQWVDLQKTRIEKASLNFNSDIHGKNNLVSADCHLELTDIVFKPHTPEEQQAKGEREVSVVTDIFKTINQGKVVLDFTIKTKIDRPEFGFGGIKMAFEEKLVQESENNKFSIFTLPSQLVEGTVRSATDLSRAVIEGSHALGKAIKQAVSPSQKANKEGSK